MSLLGIERWIVGLGRGYRSTAEFVGMYDLENHVEKNL